MKKILVVDDKESVRVILKQMLEQGGYSADTAKDGDDALAMMKNTPYDMLITDINMPVMNGVELLNRTKEAFPAMPVIFITAYGKDKIIIDAVKVGLSDFIEKPFKMEDVLKTVKEHI
jgi:DNA-binding NtrC family response regulator